MQWNTLKLQNLCSNCRIRPLILIYCSDPSFFFYLTVHIVFKWGPNQTVVQSRSRTDSNVENNKNKDVTPCMLSRQSTAKSMFTVSFVSLCAGAASTFWADDKKDEDEEQRATLLIVSLCWAMTAAFEQRCVWVNVETERGVEGLQHKWIYRTRFLLAFQDIKCYFKLQFISTSLQWSHTARPSV